MILISPGNVIPSVVFEPVIRK
ncbi:hypothetical protein V1477_001539 [Vespula maculifrons]|uniref:Uncharacterized protein n=1 Tax=Vespula maculifrons TaxID=7453 RepID=A0ABD2CYP5_VESMC